MAKNDIHFKDVTIPALDYDWYNNHVGKPVEGMESGEMKDFAEVRLEDGSYVTIWFVNSSVYNPSYIMASLHEEVNDIIQIVDIRDYESIPDNIEFENIFIHVRIGD